MTFIKKIQRIIRHHRRLKKIRKIKKKFRRFIKKFTKKETLTKLVIGIIATVMVAGMILPYIIR